MNKVFAFFMSVLTLILSFFGINIGKPDPVDPPTEPTTSIVETTEPTTKPGTLQRTDFSYMTEDWWKADEAKYSSYYNEKHHAPDAIEAEIFDRINWEREKAGVTPLTYCARTYDLVEIRAKEASQLWSHERPDGTMCSSVYRNAGISYGYFGENLGKGYSTAEQLVNGFMNSESHRNCMLSSNYTSLAIAYYVDSNNTPYYACIFIG